MTTRSTSMTLTALLSFAAVMIRLPHRTGFAVHLRQFGAGSPHPVDDSPDVSVRPADSS